MILDPGDRDVHCPEYWKQSQAEDNHTTGTDKIQDTWEVVKHQAPV
jgi:hypothetical protein